VLGVCFVLVYCMSHDFMLHLKLCGCREMPPP
jgi:hypothetical protein